MSKECRNPNAIGNATTPDSLLRISRIRVSFVIRHSDFSRRVVGGHDPAMTPGGRRPHLPLRRSARLQLRACATHLFYATSRVSDADHQWTDQKIRRAD